MATKKTKSKSGSSNKGGTSAKERPHGAGGGHKPSPSPKPAPAAKELPPLESDDPRTQAQYFMDLLAALGQQASPEAKRIRQVLIDAVTSYRDAADKVQARLELRDRLLGVEAGVAEVLLGTVRKLRDRLRSDMKRIGGSSTIGKSLQAASDGFHTLGEALETMLQAAEAQDEALRKKAYVLMETARTKLREFKF